MQIAWPLLEAARAVQLTGRAALLLSICHPLSQLRNMAASDHSLGLGILGVARPDRFLAIEPLYDM
jgi:hypothetical protein